MTGVHKAPRHRKSHHPEPEITELFRIPSVLSASPGHSNSPLIVAGKNFPGVLALPYIPASPGHYKHAPVACLIV
jgi:hypothetical protein